MIDRLAREREQHERFIVENTAALDKVYGPREEKPHQGQFSDWPTNGHCRSLPGTVNATETRRDFLGHVASGLGGIALASLLKEDALPAATPLPQAGPRAPHFIPKARGVVQELLA